MRDTVGSGLPADEDPEERQPQLVAVGHLLAVHQHLGARDVPARARTGRGACSRLAGVEGGVVDAARRLRPPPGRRRSDGPARPPARSRGPRTRRSSGPRETGADAGPGRGGPPSRRRGARCPPPRAGRRGADDRRSPAGAPDASRRGYHADAAGPSGPRGRPGREAVGRGTVYSRSHGVSERGRSPSPRAVRRPRDAAPGGAGARRAATDVRSSCGPLRAALDELRRQATRGRRRPREGAGRTGRRRHRAGRGGGPAVSREGPERHRGGRPHEPRARAAVARRRRPGSPRSPRPTRTWSTTSSAASAATARPTPSPGCGSMLGVESTVVVNNCAAAVFLAVNTLAEGRDVLVSRGELVEIGGSFRIPDVLRKGGARLREVGTTNRTRIADFRAALSPETGLILKVHPSNFRIVGFTEAPSDRGAGGAGPGGRRPAHGGPGQRAPGSPARGARPRGHRAWRPARRRGRRDLQRRQAPGRPAGRSRRRAARARRADATEPPLPGPARRQDDPGRPRRHPRRARGGARERERARPADDPRAPGGRCGRRAEAFARRLAQAAPDLHLSLQDGHSAVGGGAAPTVGVPTVVVSLAHPARGPDHTAAALRAGTPPVIVRVAEDRLLVDLRTVPPEDEPTLLDALVAATRSGIDCD